MVPVLDPTADWSRRYYVLPAFMAQPNFQSVPGIRRRGFFRLPIQRQGRGRIREARTEYNSH